MKLLRQIALREAWRSLDDAENAIEIAEVTDERNAHFIARIEKEIEVG